MRRVERWETSDGVLHTTQAKARAHCEGRVGTIIGKIAHGLVHMERYRKIGDFLIESLPDLAEAHRWQQEATADFSLHPDDDRAE